MRVARREGLEGAGRGAVSKAAATLRVGLIVRTIRLPPRTSSI